MNSTNGTEGNCNDYVKILTNPLDAAPVSLPMGDMIPHVLKTVTYNRDLAITAANQNGLFVVPTRSMRDYIRVYYYDSASQSSNFAFAINPDESLAESFVRGRPISKAIQVKSNTVASGAFAVQGTFNAISYISAPFLNGLDPGTVTSKKMDNLNVVSGASVADGIVVVSQPFADQEFRVFDTTYTPDRSDPLRITLPLRNTSYNLAVANQNTIIFRWSDAGQVPQPYPYGHATFNLNVGMDFDNSLAWAANAFPTLTLRILTYSANLVTGVRVSNNRDFNIEPGWGVPNATYTRSRTWVSYETSVDFEEETYDVEIIFNNFDATGTMFIDNTSNITLEFQDYYRYAFKEPGAIVAFQNLSQNTSITVDGKSHWEVIPTSDLGQNLPVRYATGDPMKLQAATTFITMHAGDPYRYVYTRTMFDRLIRQLAAQVPEETIVAHAATKIPILSGLLNVAKGVARPLLQAGGALLGNAVAGPVGGAIASNVGLGLGDALFGQAGTGVYGAGTGVYGAGTGVYGASVRPSFLYRSATRDTYRAGTKKKDEYILAIRDGRQREADAEMGSLSDCDDAIDEIVGHCNGGEHHQYITSDFKRLKAFLKGHTAPAEITNNVSKYSASTAQGGGVSLQGLMAARKNGTDAIPKPATGGDGGTHHDLEPKYISFSDPGAVGKRLYFTTGDIRDYTTTATAAHLDPQILVGHFPVAAEDFGLMYHISISPRPLRVRGVAHTYNAVPSLTMRILVDTMIEAWDDAMGVDLEASTFLAQLGYVGETAAYISVFPNDPNAKIKLIEGQSYEAALDALAMGYPSLSAISGTINQSLVTTDLIPKVAAAMSANLQLAILRPDPTIIETVHQILENSGFLKPANQITKIKGPTIGYYTDIPALLYMTSMALTAGAYKISRTVGVVDPNTAHSIRRQAEINERKNDPANVTLKLEDLTKEGTYEESAQEFLDNLTDMYDTMQKDGYFVVDKDHMSGRAGELSAKWLAYAKADNFDRLVPLWNNYVSWHRRKVAGPKKKSKSRATAPATAQNTLAQFMFRKK